MLLLLKVQICHHVLNQDGLTAEKSEGALHSDRNADEFVSVATNAVLHRLASFVDDSSVRQVDGNFQP